MDFKGEISPPSKLNKNILVIVDAYSKLVHAYPTKSQTAEITIECLEKWINVYGIPHRIVTDNGKAFISAEYAHFCITRGIHISYVSPYNPSAN